MLSIREYAQQTGITYEGARQKVIRYQKELGEHIVVDQNGRKFLDDFAVEFLESHRVEKIKVVQEADRSKEEQIEKLKAEVLRLQTTNENLSSKVIELLEEKTALIEDQANTKAILEVKNKEAEELAEVKKQVAAVQDKADQMEKELKSYTKTWFGLYRKNKYD